MISRWLLRNASHRLAYSCHVVASDLAGSEKPLVRTRRIRVGAVRHGCSGAPQPGFSAFIRRISSRISRVILGRPGWRDLHRQNRRKPARCQDTTVSGLTKMSASAQSEYSRRSVVQKSRSARLSLGRGYFLLKTASCCRKAAASKASLWRGTPNARTYVTTANMSEPIAPILSNGFQRS
jgi:hypothetical protein